MLHMLRQLCDRWLRSGGVERARAAFCASSLGRQLARNRETVRDALAWFGWGLAGALVLVASWELGGFAVLVGP
jgi:hypothetical protein